MNLLYNQDKKKNVVSNFSNKKLYNVYKILNYLLWLSQLLRIDNFLINEQNLEVYVVL